VRRFTSRRIAGAARRTTGIIVAQAIIQDMSQCRRKVASATKGAQAMAAATADVSPD